MLAHPTRRLVCRVALVTALVAPGGADAQLPQTRPFEQLSLSALTRRDSVVALARAQVGKRYVLGGANPDRGFDCSGLVRYVMAGLRLELPRTSRLQALVGKDLPRDTNELRPGDLLTFSSSKKGVVSHVGIYVGNGRYIHASSVAGRVIESSIDRPASRLTKAWRGARRLLTFDADTVPAGPRG